jgi:hypothetical protein
MKNALIFILLSIMHVMIGGCYASNGPSFHVNPDGENESDWTDTTDPQNDDTGQNDGLDILYDYAADPPWEPPPADFCPRVPHIAGFYELRISNALFVEGFIAAGESDSFGQGGGDLWVVKLDTLKIDRFNLSLHIGSNTVGETWKWYDNVVAATSYIGPVFQP